MNVRAYAAKTGKGRLEPFEYQLPPIGDDDVDIKVTHCGICHSDLSMLDNEWHMTQYPIVPGHEVVGTIASVGTHVHGLKIGDRVGLGWQSGSCGTCEYCKRAREHVCLTQSATIVARHGGWADYVRCQANFALPIPAGIKSEDAGPLMCAGSTVFTPILHHAVRPEHRVGVVGIGGLGHLALQFLAKMGCDVTAISSTHSKEDEARSFGAKGFIATKDAGALAKAAMSFDYLCCTVSADSDWNALINTLRPGGTLVVVGVPESEIKLQAFPMIGFERKLAGARLGSPTDGATMLEFAARHNVKPMRNDFAMKDVNAAVDHVRQGKARYRVVLHA